MMVASVASLVVGLVIGYLGQRSRICFVGAVRDFVLIRDTQKLQGLVAFLLVAWVAFPLAALVGGEHGSVGGVPTGAALLLTVIGGLGVGAISTLANGCPFRQHVLAAQGAVNGITYLAGFLAGAVIFHTVVAPVLMWLLP
ncbi:MAG: YeeE/YedE family protein [Caldilineaceae bacterium]|nr:YeeE/YedE family protein [Caldilineaceae bacterium]